MNFNVVLISNLNRLALKTDHQLNMVAKAYGKYSRKEIEKKTFLKDLMVV